MRFVMQGEKKIINKAANRFSSSVDTEKETTVQNADNITEDEMRL